MRKFDGLYLNAKCEVKSTKNTISIVSYIIEKLWSFRIQNFKLRAILVMHTSMQNLKLKAKITIKSRSLKSYDNANSYHMLGNKFDKLYFHAKS